MKSALFLLSLCFAGISLGQSEDIYSLFDQQSYTQIISKYGDQYAELEFEASFHVGMAYYKVGNDKKCIEIMDYCIKSNSTDSRPIYIKAKSLNFLGQYGKAASAFEKAIELEKTNPSYLVGLGDAYMSMSQLDKALESYTSATKIKDCPERPFQKIPLILSAMGKSQNALEAYYVAKDHIERGSDSYNNILYNIGLRESMNEDYFEAKLVLKELLDLDPSYYRAYPILIQTYMGLREYKPIAELKSKLYTAHEEGLLQYAMRDKFCFDQFTWDNKYVVKAYERFEADKQTEYFKHIFEIQENDVPVFSVQTKHTPGKSAPYVLCKSIGDEEVEYPTRFSKKDSYSNIKAAVLSVIKEKS